jgi:hypothetical protein
MTINVTTAYCKYCKKVSQLTQKSQKILARVLKDGENWCFVECAECGDIYIWESPNYKPTKPSSLIRCPVLFCNGRVLKLNADDAKFYHKIDAPCWSCGECGKVWTSRNALDEQIERIIKKYRHRNRVYQKGKDGHWKAVYPEKNSGKYEELVSEIETADYDHEQTVKKKANKNDVFRCTRLACDGYLIPYSEANLKEFHGKPLGKGKWFCINCDTSFETREEIVEEIEHLIEKYRHRSMVYKKVKGNWFPVVLTKKDSLKYQQLLLEFESFDYDVYLCVVVQAISSNQKTPDLDQDFGENSSADRNDTNEQDRKE